MQIQINAILFVLFLVVLTFAAIDVIQKHEIEALEAVVEAQAKQIREIEFKIIDLGIWETH